MTNKEAIKYLQQLYPNGGHCWLDDQRIEAVGMAIKALQKEPVSEDLEEAAENYASTDEVLPNGKVMIDFQAEKAIKAGVNWQKQQMMAKAVDVTIAIPYKNGYGGYTQLVDSKDALPFGDNIKIFVIKED